MTQLPALVKAAAAACAFVTVSYTVSVFAGPGTGTDDLGSGAPGSSAELYRRDPFPAPRRTPQAHAGGDIAIFGTELVAARDVTASSPATPVSARTGVAEAATGIGDVEAASTAADPAVTTPPSGAAVADPEPSVQPGAPSKPRPRTGTSKGRSDAHARERPARGHGRDHDRGHSHGEVRDGGRGSGCDPGARTTQARKAGRTGQAAHDRSSPRHGRR